MACFLAAAATPAFAQADLSDEAADAAEIAARARDTLRLARAHFDNGDLDEAVAAFASILDRPVKLRTRDELHLGFLYYSFTLMLQGEEELAREKVLVAIQLRPGYQPSPATTRPDLLEFYDEHSDAYDNGPSNGEEALLDQVFPELRSRSGEIRRVSSLFVPFFGLGLRKLGHTDAGNFVLGTEIVSLATNITAIIMRGAFFNDRSPHGWNVTYVSRNMNYISFGVFWGAMLVDFVVSLSLRRFYKRHPERLDTDVRVGLRQPPPPRLAPGGLAFAFW